MPLEDFTTYTEVDPNSHIAKTAQHVDFKAYRNEDAYLYKDKAVDHFGTSWEHKIDVKFVSASATGAQGQIWQLANLVDDTKGIKTALGDELFVWLYKDTATYLIGMSEVVDGTEYVSSTYSMTAGTTYYLTIKRDGTAFTCKIYSDSERTNLLATLSLTLHAGQPSHRYIYVADTWNSGSSLNLDCDIENLDLQEAGPTAKSFSDVGGGSDVFLNPYRAMPFSDVGHGVEAFNTPFRAMGFSDVGSGVDVFALLRMLAFSDVGSGTDAFTKEILGAIAKAFTDAGYGSDAFLIPFKALGFSDVGHASEAFNTFLRTMGFSDVGHGTDLFTLLRQLAFSDVAHGTDAFLILLKALGFSDVSHGTDAFIIPYRAMGFADSGYGTESFLIVFKTVFFSDAGYGSDSFGSYIPGVVKKTKLFLVIGDLAIQIAGD